MTGKEMEWPRRNRVDYRSDDERIIEIELERLRDFKNHPFRIADDEQMQELIESIKYFGILNPLIVRPLPEGVYEVISGHRRKYAAGRLGYRKVPVVIRVMSDEEAVIGMVDANLQRAAIHPSERAFAIKMRYEAMRRLPGRKKGGQDDQNIPFYNGHRHMAFMLHGHTHKTEESVLEEQFKDQLRAGGQRCEAYNVGAMWQGYEPQTFEEIVARQGRTIPLI